MKKNKYIPLRVDDEMFKLIQKCEGNSTAQKIRNLIIQALNVEEVATYKQL